MKVYGLLTLATVCVSCFAVPADSDGDGLPDTWEQGIIDASPTDGIVSIQDVLPEHDFDLDRRSNQIEFANGSSPIVRDSCYPVSQAQIAQLAENQAKLDLAVASPRFDDTWVRNWTWTDFDAGNFETLVEGEPLAVKLHPLAVNTGSFYQYVNIPSEGVPQLSIDVATWSDSYLALFVNSKKVWEGPISGAWHNLRFDLRPWAGQRIQVEVAQGAGGPNSIWNFEHLDVRNAAVLTLDQAPPSLISTAEIPDNQSCRWFDRWTVREDAHRDLNQDVINVSALMDGRMFVLNTHPRSEDQPAILETVARLPQQGAKLRMVVRSSGDFKLLAFAGSTLVASNIVAAQGWTEIDVDLSEFSGQTLPIRIEHWSGGEAPWSFETAHWADIFVSSLPLMSIRTSEVEICWDSLPSVTYTLEARDSSVGAEWIAIGEPVIGDGGQYCAKVEVPDGSSHRLFRLVPVYP